MVPSPSPQAFTRFGGTSPTPTTLAPTVWVCHDVRLVSMAPGRQFFSFALIFYFLCKSLVLRQFPSAPMTRWWYMQPTTLTTPALFTTMACLLIKRLGTMVLSALPSVVFRTARRSLTRLTSQTRVSLEPTGFMHIPPYGCLAFNTCHFLITSSGSIYGRSPCSLRHPSSERDSEVRR